MALPMNAEVKQAVMASRPGFDLGCPRQDSNLRPRLRRAVLYPLSYGGSATKELYQARRPDLRRAGCVPHDGSGSALNWLNRLRRLVMSFC